MVNIPGDRCDGPAYVKSSRHSRTVNPCHPLTHTTASHAQAQAEEVKEKHPQPPGVPRGG